MISELEVVVVGEAVVDVICPPPQEHVFTVVVKVRLDVVNVNAVSFSAGWCNVVVDVSFIAIIVVLIVLEIGHKVFVNT